MSNRSLDRVLDPEFLAGLESWTAETLRARRAEVQRLEDAASFLRRMAQARLDVCEAELASRFAGPSATVGELVDRLPSILAEGTTRASVASGRLPTGGPTTDQERWAMARLDAVCGEAALAGLPDLSTTDIQERAEALSLLEKEVSVERRALHDLLDKIQAQLVHCYKTGRATIDGLLR